MNLHAALKARFPAPSWVVLFEVRNGTGFARSRARTADAVAMSTWPSRGLELHGFEIKASRSDWVRERDDPAKAEEGLFHFCDRWWLVLADEKLIQPGELPATWGLLVPRGEKLRAAVEAPALTPRPVDRLTLAALLRAAVESPATAINAAVERTRKECDAGWRRTYQNLEERVKKNAKEKEEEIREFEKAAGIRIGGYYQNPEEQGKKFRKFREFFSREDAAEQLERSASILEEAAKNARRELELLREEKEAGVR